MSDIDDLIGEEVPAPKRGPGRPRKNAAKPPAKKPPRTPAGLPGEEETLSMDIADVYGGVSAHWLSQVFGYDKNTIKKRLAKANLEVVGRRNGGQLYRIADAAQWLVKPKVDLTSYIKSLRPNDLPPMLNDNYWSAMLKRQKWEENAKDLWRTEDVLAVFGDVAFMIKTTSQLWVEEIDRHHTLTPEMRETLTQLVDNLLEQIHENLIEMPQSKKTPSSVAEEGAMPEGEKPQKPEDVDIV